MYNFFKNFTPLLLVILKLCISVSGNYTINDLGLVCAIRNNSKLTAIPAQCSAVAVYSGSEMEQLGAVNLMKGDKPLLIVMGHVKWNEIIDIIKHDIGEVLNPFKNVGFDFMVFDNTYKFQWKQIFGGSSSGASYSQNIASFLKKAREYFPPGKQYGLVLGHDVNSMEDNIELSVLNDHSDFFLLESTGYRDCDAHIHQADMEVLATRDDVFSSLQDLKKAQVAINKVLYTIELKIESRKFTDTEDMDYTYLCSNDLSDDRKYCFNTIQCLFEKARLRQSEGTAGIFINGIDSDDYGGACGCITPSDPDPTFRGLKTIAGASQEDKNDVSFYDCSDGGFPVIKN